MLHCNLRRSQPELASLGDNRIRVTPARRNTNDVECTLISVIRCCNDLKRLGAD